MSDVICHQCGKPLPPTARRHARFCSPAHRAAYHRSSTATRMAYVAIAPDERFSGMYRLKRTDGTLSDMVNLTRAKDALAAMHVTHKKMPGREGPDNLKGSSSETCTNAEASAQAF